MDQQAWLDGAKHRFDFDTWPRRLGIDALPRTHGFALDLGARTGAWEWERRLPHGDGGYADYYRQTGAPQHRIMVRVTEHASHDAALRALLELLSMSMAVTLPRLDDRDGGVGDVAFTGHDALISQLYFVRHNVLIDLRSIGEEPVSVLPLAALVDEQIQAAATSL